MNTDDNGNGKVKLHVQVARIEECVSNLRDEVRNLKENHLQHINSRLDNVENSINDLKVSMARWAGGLSAGLVLIEVLLRFYHN